MQHSVQPLRHVEPQESIRHLVLLHLSAVRRDEYLKIVSLDEMTIERHRTAPCWNWWRIAQVKNANSFIARHSQIRKVAGRTCGITVHQMRCVICVEGAHAASLNRRASSLSRRKRSLSAS